MAPRSKDIDDMIDLTCLSQISCIRAIRQFRKKVNENPGLLRREGSITVIDNYNGT
jgi:hypothetical protein